MTPRRLSVVVASPRRRALLDACLAALLPQCIDRGAEVIVARAAGHADLDELRRAYSDVQVLAANPGSDIPRLRGLGMNQAAGDLVVVTEDHCLAQPGWLAGLAGASQDAHVIGGSVGNARDERAVDQAAYYSEYGFFSWTRPPSPTALPLLTGANVAYARPVVADVAAWAREGGWESIAHERLARRGCRLKFVPEARVMQNATFGFGAFCADRYEHGRDHARAQLAEYGTLMRWARLFGSPLVPAMLLWRVYRAAGSQGHVRFLQALPYTAAFLASWSAGEAAGYVRGAMMKPHAEADGRS